MSLSNAEVDDVLDAIEKHFADRLTSWETDFIESISAQWEQAMFLTAKQREKLEEIFERFAHG